MIKIGHFRIFSKKDWDSLVALRNDYIDKTFRAGMMNVDLDNIEYFLNEGQIDIALKKIHEDQVPIKDEVKKCCTNYELLANANLLVIPED